MALTAAQLALVEAFQKASDDKVLAIVKDMFNIDYGTKSCSVGDNVVSLAVDAYDDTNYILDIVEAIDGDGIDVTEELSISKTTTGFTINALTVCTVKWQTSRQTPKINFHT